MGGALWVHWVGGGQIIEKEIPVHMPVDRVVEIPVETTVYKVANPARNLLSIVAAAVHTVRP